MAEIIVKMVSNPKFVAIMQEKINRKVDIAAIDGEIVDYEKQLRQHYAVKSKLAEEIDTLFLRERKGNSEVIWREQRSF